MIQSMWHASGSNAAHIRELAVFFGLLLSLIFLIVVGLALFSLGRRHRGIEQEPLEGSHQPSARTEAKLRTVVGIATGFTILILFRLTAFRHGAHTRQNQAKPLVYLQRANLSQIPRPPTPLAGIKA